MAIDYYKIFALPKSYALDAAALEQNYRRLSTQYHPDKTAHLSAFEQKQAVMLSATINEAYRILKSPLDRAAYLLQEQGIHADAPENTRFEAAFLMQQMQWREDLDDAGHDENALLALNRQIVAARDALQAALNQDFADEQWETAPITCVKAVSSTNYCNKSSKPYLNTKTEHTHGFITNRRTRHVSSTTPTPLGCGHRLRHHQQFGRHRTKRQRPLFAR